MINKRKLINFIYDLEWLKDLENPFPIVDNIAQAFKDAYGSVIFESELYYCQHEVATIMDTLESQEYGIDEVVAWLLLRAFKKAKFKYAAECSMRELREKYASMGYTPYALSTKFKTQTYAGYLYDTYEYDQIKEDRADLNREIVEYAHHPSRIQKWIESGKDIEDYLD